MCNNIKLLYMEKIKHKVIKRMRNPFLDNETKLKERFLFLFNKLIRLDLYGYPYSDNGAPIYRVSVIIRNYTDHKVLGVKSSIPLWFDDTLRKSGMKKYFLLHK